MRKMIACRLMAMVLTGCASCYNDSSCRMNECMIGVYDKIETLHLLRE